MNLFVYELKKIFSKKVVIVLMVAFLLLDIMKIYMLYFETIKIDTLYEGRNKIICEIRGPITEEKLSFIVEKKRELEELVSSRAYSTEYNPSTYSGYEFGDYIIFRDVYDDLDYAYHYSDFLEQIRLKANENMELFPNNSPEFKSAKKISEIYKDREILDYYDFTGYESFLFYDFSSLLVLLLILFSIKCLLARFVLSSIAGRTERVKLV